MKNNASFFKYSILSLIVVAFLFPVFVFAGGGYHDRDYIDKETKFVFGENIYVLGDYLNINEDITGDFYSISESLVVSKNIQNDLNAIANAVVVDGVVSDDVRLVAKKVVINGRVDGTLMFFGNDLVISQTAVVTGDLLINSELLEIEGRILGNVFFNGELVKLGDNARISGDLDVSVHSEENVVISEKASISGEVIFSQIDYDKDGDNYLRYLWFVFGFALFGLLLALAWREKITLFKRDSYEQLKGLGIGILILLLIIPFIILSYSVFGLVIGMSIMFAYLGLVSLGALLTPIYLGELIRDVTKTNWDYRVYPVIAGVIIALLLLLEYTALLVLILYIIVLGLVVKKILKQIC